jgi:hypothetical protein
MRIPWLVHIQHVNTDKLSHCVQNYMRPAARNVDYMVLSEITQPRTLLKKEDLGQLV